MPKIHIDEVHTKNEVSPMILNFQNGYPTEHFKADECLLLHNELNDCRSVAVEINSMLYAGDEQKEQLGKTLILAKNRVTGKVRLIEVGNALLKPILKVDTEESIAQDTSYLELSRKFGSKKQKQQVEHREKLKVNVETVTEQMQNATQNITEDKLDLSAYNKNDSDDFYIPPIDRLAAKPEDVYDIDKMLTEEEYEKIYSELEDKDYASEFSPFIQSITDKKLTNRKTVLAVYANCLLKYSLVLAKDLIKKTFVACSHSSTLNDIIFKNFATINNGKRCRPMPYKDKAICHAVVYALLVNGLKFPLETFCEDAKLTPTNAATKIKVTGASIVNTGGKKVVQLKLPLAAKGGFGRRKSARF